MKSLAFSRLEGKVEIVYPVNKSFGAAKDAWIATWLRHLNAKLVVAVARSFNQRDHKAKGQLRGWKKWETLQRETGLSEDTVWRFFKKAEQMGSLDIEHGRYDPVKKRRDYNRYQARCPNMSGQTNPAPVRKSNPAPVREYSLKEDYLTKVLISAFGAGGSAAFGCFAAGESEEGRARRAEGTPCCLGWPLMGRGGCGAREWGFRAADGYHQA